jgi:Clathrin light chain
MSNFPSIEEFDSGQVTATKLEDASDDMDLFHSAQDDFLAREQAVLGDDADFFQSARNTSPPSQGEAAFFGGNQGIQPPLWFRVLMNPDEDVHEFETSFPAIETTV